MTTALAGGWIHTSHVEDCPDLGPSCASQNPPSAERHVVDLLSMDLRLDAELGLLRWLSIETTWWLRLVHQSVSYTDLNGYMIVAPDENLHHRNETLIGPADPWLLARVGLARGPLTASLRLGFTIPLGSTVPNPFVLGDQGISHEHIQFGSGTVDPLVGVDLRYYFTHFSVGGWALARLPLYENGYGYQAGRQYFGGIFASSRFGLPTFTFFLGLDVAGQEAERWSGQVESEGNLGRVDLLVDGAVQWRFAEHWSATLTGRVDVYTAAVGEQAVSPLVLELALSRAFELW